MAACHGVRQPRALPFANCVTWTCQFVWASSVKGLTGLSPGIVRQWKTLHVGPGTKWILNRNSFFSCLPFKAFCSLPEFLGD